MYVAGRLKLSKHFYSHQRFKIIYFLMVLWDAQAMILLGPRVLGMGSIIDILFIGI